MTVRVYNHFIFDRILRLVGPIYEHDYEKRCGWRRLPGRQVIVVGAAHFPRGNGQSILRRRVFAGLSADDRSANGRITTCEALLRWNHPLRGVILPGDFV